MIPEQIDTDEGPVFLATVEGTCSPEGCSASPSLTATPPLN